MSGRVERWLRASERTPDRTVDERVAELLEAVRRGAQRNPGESWDTASERHAEEFIAALCAGHPGRAFEIHWPPAHDQPEKMLLQSLAYADARPGPGEGPRREPVVLIERQRLRPLARRTTGYNYVFTVPGESLERLVLVAHYDTWRGPGADDNTTVLGCPRWLGCHRQGKRRIPAAALVALLPGKASPIVFGGKIHTKHDTADRVYPGPLAEALRILDYWLHLMQGGPRIAEPRDLGEFHYAQLFRVRRTAAAPRVHEAEDEHWLALKDAIEPNRRNLNGLYRVDVSMSDGFARCERPRMAAWGVDTRLGAELASQLPPGAVQERLAVRRLELGTPDGVIVFESRRRTVRDRLEAAGNDALGALERFMGANTFLAFFGAAFLLAKVVEAVLGLAFRWAAFQEVFFRYFAVTLSVTIVLQLGVVVWLVGKKIPTMIDNAYRHQNKADNLRSLRRVPA